MILLIVAMRMYEQQLAAMSSLSAANPAANLLTASYNPFMMGTAAFGGLGAFSGLGAATAIPGLGGMSAAEYQAALAAAMTPGFPATGQ